jgi:ribonuclease P protein component
MTVKLTFKKTERLFLNNLIETLFNAGIIIYQHPLKLIWLPVNDSFKFPAQVLFSVSRKRFKKAVDRNRIKRKIKELYRIEKIFLYEELNKRNKQIILCISYTGNSNNPSSTELKNRLKQGFNALLKELDKH